MKLLVTGAFKCADKELNALQEMGHKVIFMQNESDSPPCKYLQRIISSPSNRKIHFFKIYPAYKRRLRPSAYGLYPKKEY